MSNWGNVKNWSQKAMNSTYRAVTAAGFNNETFKELREVIFVTEPEAAAMFTARWEKEAKGKEFLRVCSQLVAR